ncbi:MAG: cell wall hydrolase [Eubacterium sp.]|nr:cell wall hydrolase [Eubacterium sp.]
MRKKTFRINFKISKKLIYVIASSLVIAECLGNIKLISLAGPVDVFEETVLKDVKTDKDDADATAEANKNTAEILVEQIKEVNDRISQISSKIEFSKSSLDAIDKDILECEQEMTEADENIRAERAKLSTALQTMYESSGSDDLLSLMLRSDDEYDLINREEYVSDFSSYINKEIGDIQVLVDEKEDQSYDLLLLRSDREVEVENYENIQKELSSEIDELTELMEEAEKKAEDAQSFAEELAEEVAKLEAEERAALERRSYNGDTSNVVYDGDGTDYYYVSPYPYTVDELDILAAIIQAEAGSVSYPGMIAVGSVVMNRVEDSRFANTISGVIYAPYQFEPVSSGSFAVILAQGPVAACYQAAQDVLDGKRNVPNFYFKAAWYAEEHGISGVNIGGNVFH